MRILALLPFALAALAHPAAASGYARAGVVTCDADARRATFEGDMQRRPGTARMQMRFVLRARSGGRWAPVRASGLRGWHTADPGVARYVYTRTVEELPAPGAYRVHVAFRWLDEGGGVLARRARRSPVCRMPDPRPDLMALSVLARPGGWAVVVRNSGRSDARGFLVAAAVDGAEREPRAVDGLGAGDEVEVEFDGPCAEHVRVTLDPEDSVEERDEDDNVFEAPCPALG